MLLRTLLMLAFAAAAGGCSTRDANLAAASGAPAYVPGNAAPPTLTAASNELVGPVWHWQRTQWTDGRVVTAVAPERYTLRFEGGGRVLVQADCNRGGGTYEVNGGAMKMGPAALTRMGCPPGSQDREFVPALASVTSYAIANYELLLTLADGGIMHFRARP